MGTGPRNLDRLTTIYGPTTWDVYARLDESLDPRGPDMLYDLAAEHIADGDTILDAGCRDAAHLIELARRHLHYDVFLFLGKLEPVIHVLRKGTPA